MCKKVVCFDLDDTLYKEIDFLKSGFRKVAELVGRRYGLDVRIIYDHLLNWYYGGKNAFECLNEHYGLDNPISDYLNVYRFHYPSLVLSQDVQDTLTALKCADYELGIITDGREITQRQKVEVLGLDEWIPMEMVLINENKKYFKPNPWSFDRMMMQCYEKYPNSNLAFYYVGDNTKKDFYAGNQLGWDTICLGDGGWNIHKQNYEIADDYLPKYRIKSIVELLDVVGLKQ